MNPPTNHPDQTSSLPGWNPGFVLMLLACVIGGLVGGFVVHQMHPFFAYKQLPPLELGSPPELVQEHHDAAFAYRTRNYAVEFAIIGLALGLAIGACSRGPRWLLCIFSGGCIGTLCGLGLGFASGLYITQNLLVNAQQTLQTSMGLQTVVWGVLLANIVGVVAFLQVGMIEAIKYWFVGLLAGFVVAATQFATSSLMFPSSNPMFLVPEQASERVYWLAIFPIAAGLVMALGLTKLRPQQTQAVSVN